MTSEKEISDLYLGMANDLEAEFFEVIDKGEPSQRRVLKTGKTLSEFNQRHGEIWRDCEDELVTQGHLKRPEIVDYPALYAQAVTSEEKLDVLARLLELKE